MKGSWKIALVAMAVAAIVVASIAPASLAQTQIQVTFTEGPFTRYVDVGKPGTSPGDEFLEIHALTDAASGAEAGTTFTRFETVRVHKGEDLTFILDGTLRLTDGDIAFYGTERYSHVFTPAGVRLAVVGATGSFIGMEGTVHVVSAEPGVFLVTVDLIAG